MTAADFSDKWSRLPPPERRLTGIRAIELADPAAEATGHCPGTARSGRNAGPDRGARHSRPDAGGARVRLAGALGDRGGRQRRASPVATASRHSAARHCQRRRRGIRAGGLACLAQASAGRRRGRRAARLARPGPRSRPRLARPAPGGGHCRPRPPFRRQEGRPVVAGGSAVAAVDATERFCRAPARWTASPSALSRKRAGPVRRRAPGRARTGAWPASWSPSWKARPTRAGWRSIRTNGGPVLRQMLDAQAGSPALWRPSARLHLGSARSAAPAGRSDDPRRAERRRLAGAWPAPDPWLAPKIRADLGLPGLDFRTGLAAHDFASALGRAASADHPRAARQPSRRPSLRASGCGWKR